MKRGRRIWIWVLVFLLSWAGGWQLAAQEESGPSLTQDQLEQGSYVRHCGTCHVALPASVMPTQSWQMLLQNPDHYGQQIPLPTGTTLQLAWEYLRDNSRPLLEREEMPIRLANSRPFRALHPDVEFPLTIQVNGCIDCHGGAEQGDFGSFSWPDQL